MIDSPYFLKHNGKLDPIVSRDIDLETGDIPQWSDEAQHLSKSNISQTESKVIIDNKLEVTDDTTIHGNLDLDTGDFTITGDGNITITGSGDITVNDGDLKIKGNIIQEGESYETHAEQLYTTKDHIILREGAITGLFENEHSGIIVSKYDGENNVHLCVTNTGYAQVGETDDNGDPYDVEYQYEFMDTDVYKRDGKYYNSDDKNTDEFNEEHEFYIPKEAYDIEIEDDSDPDYVPPSQDETPELEAAGSLESLYPDMDSIYKYEEANTIDFFFDFANDTPNYNWVPQQTDSSSGAVLDTAHYQLVGTAKYIDYNKEYVKITRLEKVSDGILINSSFTVESTTMLFNQTEYKSAIDKRYFLYEDYDSLENDGKKFISTVEIVRNRYQITWSDETVTTIDGATILYHMVTPEISQFLGEAVTVTVRYKLKEKSLQRLLTIEPNPQANSLLYYDEVSKQARTLQLPDTETIPLVPVLENGRIAYRKYKNDTSVSFDVSVSQIAFDAAHPIDEVYTQYPYQKSPEEVYNKNGVHSVWERIKDYDGAFFRAEGGLAEDFKETKEEGAVIQVLEAPFVFLNYNIDYVNRKPKGFSYQAVQLGYQNSTTDYAYNPSFYQLTRDMVHIVAIYVLGNDQYRLKFENDVQLDVTGSVLIYNYDVPIGTLSEVLARKESWASEIHDDFSIDTTNGNAIVSTASAASPSTTQHITKVVPIVNGTTSVATQEAGVQQILTNRSQIVYDKNVSLGHLEGQFTKWNTEVTTLDRPHAWPMESWLNQGRIYTMSNTTAPTDAQIITDIYKLEEQNLYTVEFADGHSANYSGSTAYYVVEPNEELAAKTLVCRNCGYLSSIFYQWHLSDEPMTVKCRVFYNTEDYVYTWKSISGVPTDAQIVERYYMILSASSGNGPYGIIQFRDGSTTVVNDDSSNFIYRKDLINNTNTQVVATPMECVGGFDVKSHDEDVYLAPTNEDCILSSASAASPTDAQKIEFARFDNINDEAFLLNASYKDAFEVKKVSGAVDSNTNRLASVYNKNTLWGTYSAMKLDFEESTYDYHDPITDETVKNKQWVCSTPLFEKTTGNALIDFRESGEGQWIYRMNTETGIVANVLSNIATQVNFLDEEGNEYGVTLQTCMYPAIKSSLKYTYFYPPYCGMPTGNSGKYLWHLWNTDGQIKEYSGIEPNYEYGRNNNHTTGLFCCYRVPGTNIAISIRFTGQQIQNADTSTSVARTCTGIQTTMNGLEYLYTSGETELIDAPIETWEPPEYGLNGDEVILNTANKAAPSNTEDIIKIGRIPGTYRWVCMRSAGYYIMESYNTAIYDRNLTYRYTAGIPYNFEIRTHEVAYWYPPEVDWRGEEYIATIASTATPTDAQRVIKIDPLEGSTNYNVYFADGHTAVYAQTQAIYNANKYYTTIWGIVTCYYEIDIGTTKVLYNVAIRDDWKIGNDIVKVTRYTGVVTNNAATYYSYDDVELTTPIQRNNTVNMTGVNEDGTTFTTPEGYSQTYLRSDESYLIKQLDSAPEIYAVNGDNHIRNTVGSYNRGGGAIEVGPNIYAYTGDCHETTGSTIFDFKASRVTQTYGRRGEVAPANYTIRIWKRIR